MGCVCRVEGVESFFQSIDKLIALAPMARQCKA